MNLNEQLNNIEAEVETAAKEVVDFVTTYRESNGGSIGEALMVFADKAKPVQVVEEALVVYWPTLSETPNAGRELIRNKEEWNRYVANLGEPGAVWTLQTCPELDMHSVEVHGRGIFNGTMTYLTEKAGAINLDAIIMDRLRDSNEGPMMMHNVVKTPGSDGEWVRLEFVEKYKE